MLIATVFCSLSVLTRSTLTVDFCRGFEQALKINGEMTKIKEILMSYT